MVKLRINGILNRFEIFPLEENCGVICVEKELYVIATASDVIYIKQETNGTED